VDALNTDSILVCWFVEIKPLGRFAFLHIPKLILATLLPDQTWKMQGEPGASQRTMLGLLPVGTTCKHGGSLDHAWRCCRSIEAELLESKSL
jgi:hypothetical protein